MWVNSDANFADAFSRSSNAPLRLEPANRTTTGREAAAAGSAVCGSSTPSPPADVRNQLGDAENAEGTAALLSGRIRACEVTDVPEEVRAMLARIRRAEGDEAEGDGSLEQAAARAMARLRAAAVVLAASRDGP